MVRIDSTSSASKARPTARVRKGGKKGGASASSRAGGDFALSLSGVSGSGGVEGVEAEVGVEASVDLDIGLLSLQERGGIGGRGEDGERRRAIAYGEGLIDRLEALHVRLLSGFVSEEELLRLGESFSEGDGVLGVEDEKLRLILQEIELRVQVELAKRR